MGQIEVEAPIKKRIAGRSKMTRFLSCGEFKKHNIKCGKCGEYGHNKKTCRNRAVVKSKKYQIIFFIILVEQLTLQ